MRDQRHSPAAFGCVGSLLFGIVAFAMIPFAGFACGEEWGAVPAVRMGAASPATKNSTAGRVFANGQGEVVREISSATGSFRAPIVANGRVFATAMVSEQTVWRVACFDAASSGTLLLATREFDTGKSPADHAASQ